MEDKEVVAAALSSDTLKEPFLNLVNPVTKNAGNTLGDLWFLTFGWISHLAEKAQIRYAYNLDKFKQSLVANIQKIPPEKIIEPELRIIGPALEASRYHYEAPGIRDMFAKLIASSMNADYVEYVHPAFVPIIEQMTPLEAETLQYIATNESKMYNGSIPLAQLRFPYASGGEEAVFLHLTLMESDTDKIVKQSEALDTLARNKLINITDDSLTKHSHLYKEFESYSCFQWYRRRAAENPEKYKPPKIAKKTAMVTQFGCSFCTVCLP